ncbi:MAG: LytR/AlgR family response regulator transcription factor [Flavobacteriaceae bacterium]
MIRCLIIEDEADAREILKTYIHKTPSLHCIGEYESGMDVPPSELEQVDFIFLDIQLPEIDGLSFLKTLSAPPKVIITTAFAAYALEAYEEAVMDYLVKPFSYERFCKSIIRIKDYLNRAMPQKGSSMFIYADKTFYNIAVDSIAYIKAEVDYVSVVTNTTSYLVHDSLGNWEKKLAPSGFIKVHRSYVVNIAKIHKVVGNQIHTKMGVIPLSATYKEKFKQLLSSH